MQKSVMKIYEHCAFCAPGSQSISDSPICVSTAFVGSNIDIPFCLTFHWYSTFARGKLFVNGLVSLRAFKKLGKKRVWCGRSIGFVW